ncbi:hypothetical protein IGI04_030621, partial [Brassica rapa subsp. trilocularis]
SISKPKSTLNPNSKEAPVSKSPVAVYFSDVSPRPAESISGRQETLLKWEKVYSSRVITVLNWLKISGSAADMVFEVVSSEM